MNNINKVIIGLQIFAKYIGEVGVAHDKILCGGLDAIEKLTDSDKKELEDNDWFLDEDLEAWTIFV